MGICGFGVRHRASSAAATFPRPGKRGCRNVYCSTFPPPVSTLHFFYPSTKRSSGISRHWSHKKIGSSSLFVTGLLFRWRSFEIAFVFPSLPWASYAQGSARSPQLQCCGSKDAPPVRALPPYLFFFHYPQLSTSMQPPGWPPAFCVTGIHRSHFLWHIFFRGLCILR